MGDDFFPARPGLGVDVEGRVQLNPGPLGDGGAVVADAIGMCGRAGGKSLAGVGIGQEQRMVNVPLGNFFRADDPTEGGKPCRNRSMTMDRGAAVGPPAGSVGDEPPAA